MFKFIYNSNNLFQDKLEEIRNNSESRINILWEKYQEEESKAISSLTGDSQKPTTKVVGLKTN